MAIIRINPDHSVERLSCGTELHDLQQALDDAYIEDAGSFIFRYGERNHESYHLIVDEEGKLKGLPINLLATAATGLYPCDMLVGRVLVVSLQYDEETEEYGYSDIPEECIGDLMDYLNDLKEELEERRDE